MVVGDQMTCKNIRGSKLWRQTEVNSIDKLGWVNEVPGTHIILLNMAFLTI